MKNTKTIKTFPKVNPKSILYIQTSYKKLKVLVVMRKILQSIEFLIFSTIKNLPFCSNQLFLDSFL